MADGGLTSKADAIVPYCIFGTHVYEFADHYNPQFMEELFNFNTLQMQSIFECVVVIQKEHRHLLYAIPIFSLEMQPHLSYRCCPPQLCTILCVCRCMAMWIGL